MSRGRGVDDRAAAGAGQDYAASFAEALYGWKKGLIQSVVDAIELELLNEAPQPVDGDNEATLFKRMLLSLTEQVRA